MNNANHGDSYNVEKLDADAVCAQCSTVNTEGTLLCKVCGNNLRDQRNRRLMADQAMDLEHTGKRHKAWVSAAFFFLALILVVSTLLNQELIVEWVIGIQGAEKGGIGDLWLGDYDATFQPLVDDLAAAAYTGETARAALEGAVAAPAIDGTYVLFSGEDFIGSARVFTHEDYIYFAALLANGDEARGIAKSQGNYVITLPDSAGMRERRRIFAIQGSATPDSNGSMKCSGDNFIDRANFQAFRLPDS